MSQTNTDLLYIDDDYYYPDWYFVYTALAAAEATLAASITVTADRIKSASASIDASTDVTAIPNKIKSASATISSSADVSATATIILGSGAAVSSQATVVATISHIHGADLVAFTNGSLTAAAGIIKQYPVSQYAAVKAVSADSQYVQHVTSTYGSNFNWGSNANRIISFWGKKSNTSDAEGYYISQAAADDAQFYVGWRGTTHIDMWVWAVSGAQVSYRWTNAQPNDTNWHHYAIVSRGKTYRPSNYDNGFAFDLYVDGVYKGTRTAYSVSSDIWYMYGRVTRVGAFNAQVNGPTYWDGSAPGWRYSNLCLAQLYIGPITIPDTLNLSDYYDGNVVDLGSSGVVNGSNPWIYETFAAGFSSDITKYKNGNTTSPIADFYCDVGIAVPNIKGKFSLAVTADVQQIAYASLTSQFSITASATTAYEGFATISSQATVTAAADNRTRTITETFTTAATVTAIGDRNSGITANLSSAATLVATGYRTQEIILVAFANSQVTTQANKTAIGSTAIATEATITVEAVKRVDSADNLASAATVTGVPTRILAANSQLNTAADLYARSTGVQKFEAALSSEFTVTAQAERFVGYRAEFNTQATITATAYRNVSASSTLATAASLNTAAATTADSSSSLSTAFTTTAIGYRTKELVLSAFTNALVSTSAIRVRSAAASLNTQATVAVTGTRLIGNITADMQAMFALNASARRTRGYACSLTALDFILADGKVLKSDTYWSIKVQPETRLLQTPQESLIIPVLAESRVNIVEAETRAIKVRPETLVLDY